MPVDPKASFVDNADKPLSSDELASDAAAAPQDAEQPPLTRAGEIDRPLRDNDADVDTQTSGDQGEVVEHSLTNLPPG